MRANRLEISRLERENFEAWVWGVNGFRISGFEASDFKIEGFGVEGFRIEGFRIEPACKPSLAWAAWVLLGVGFMVAPLGKIG